MDQARIKLKLAGVVIRGRRKTIRRKGTSYSKLEEK